MRQPVEQPSDRAHPPHESSGLVPDREVDDSHAGRGRRPAALSLHDAPDRPMEQVGEQSVREDLLMVAEELVRVA